MIFPLHGSQHRRHQTAEFCRGPTELLMDQLQMQPLICPWEDENALTMPKVFSKGEFRSDYVKGVRQYPYHILNSMEITENLVEETGSDPLATLQNSSHTEE